MWSMDAGFLKTEHGNGFTVKSSYKFSFSHLV